MRKYKCPKHKVWMILIESKTITRKRHTGNNTWTTVPFTYWKCPVCEFCKPAKYGQGSKRRQQGVNDGGK